jgi:hypothetical protein
MEVQTSPTGPSAQALLFTSNPRADPTSKDVTRTVIRAGSHRPGLAVSATESPAPSRPYSPCLRHSLPNAVGNLCHCVVPAFGGPDGVVYFTPPVRVTGPR